MTLNITTGENVTDSSGGNSQPAKRNQMNDRDQHGSGAEGGECRSGGLLALLPQLLVGLLLLAELGSCPLWAQTNAAKAAPSSHRWLLVVETSKSMQRRTEASFGILQDWLTSGLDGQLRAGDTLGLWTFNEDLYAGRFPLQKWSPEAQKEITERTMTFLKAQKYEKQPRFDKVVAALRRVMNDSELITVILISSGDDNVQGTPIDGRINEYYQQWRDHLQKAHMPFVIVLRAQSGQLADCVVNIPAWPLQLPRLSSEVGSAQKVPKSSSEAVAKTAPPAVPPLIVSEKELKPERTPTPKREPTVGKAEVPPPLDAAVITNEPVKAKPPEPATPPVEVAKAEPSPTVEAATTQKEPVKAKPPETVAKPVEVARTGPLTAMPDMPATQSAPKPASATTPVAQPKEETGSAPQSKPVEPAPTKLEPTPPPQPPMSKPELITIEPPKPSPAPQATTFSAPAASQTQQEAPEIAAVSAATQPAPSATSSPAPRTSSLPTPPVQNATAVPAGTLTSQLNIWIAGLVLAVVAAVSAFLLIRRSHAAQQASLITRSFEREKKP
jgi:hypothetical protein